MKNPGLIRDYVERAYSRLFALEVLYQRENWADVVRESQEVVELTLKALLRYGGLEVPRIHDVGPILLENQSRYPKSLDSLLQKAAKISKTLRRDREIAFYGTEDLTPSTFYDRDDATTAIKDSIWLVREVVKATGVRVPDEWPSI